MPIKNPAKRRAYERRRDATPARRRARSLGVMARRKMKKKYGAKAIAGKDIDHKKPITKGGTNAMSNLRIMSRRKNRARKSKRR